MRRLILISLMTGTVRQQHSTQADTEIDKDNGSANTYISVTAPTTDNLYLTQAPTLTLQIRKLLHKVL